MRSLLAIVAVAVATLACSSPRGSTEREPHRSGAPVVVPSAPLFIAPAASSVMRMARDQFVIARFLTELIGAPPPCWTQQLERIDRGYQVEIAPRSSYFIIEGNHVRAELETCVAEALAKVFPIEVTREGELTAIRPRSSDGSIDPAATAIYARWASPVIVVGSKADLERAASTPASDTLWRTRLAELPASSPLAVWSENALVDNLLGIPAASWTLAFDRLARTPSPSFAGQLVARFASVDAAAQAAGRVQRGEIAGDAPAELRAALARLKTTQRADRLELAFDETTFASVDLALLQRWVNSLAAGAP